MDTINRQMHTHTFKALGLTARMTVDSGASVTFDTLDALEGLSEDAAMDRYRPGPDAVNPATGPVYVNGAEAGDVLEVEILDVRCDPEGYVSLWMPRIGEHAPERDYARIELKDGFALIEGVPFALDPMVGTIGVAHPEGLDTRYPGVWGGNLDTKEVKKGAKLFLPVFTEGALLAMGDMHALQGDGEVFGQGIETGGQVDVRVTVLKGFPLDNPLLVTRGGAVQTIAAHEDLNAAGEKAILDMGQLLIRWGLTKRAAALLIATKGDLYISEIVNPKQAVRMSVAVSDIQRLNGSVRIGREVIKS